MPYSVLVYTVELNAPRPPPGDQRGGTGNGTTHTRVEANSLSTARSVFTRTFSAEQNRTCSGSGTHRRECPVKC